MPPKTAPDRSSSDRTAGLDRDDVVDTALAMVEAGGGKALTMRKLAAELGVAPTAIYWHVGNRDDLIAAVVQRQAERQASAVVVGDTPAERIVSAASNIWDNALAHRNVTALASAAGLTTLLALPLELAVVAELEAAGLRGETARDALRSILACIAGFLIVAWRTDDAVSAEHRAGALWAAVDDPRLSPQTVASLAERGDVDEMFRTTLATIVAGVLSENEDRDQGDRR